MGLIKEYSRRNVLPAVLVRMYECKKTVSGYSRLQDWLPFRVQLLKLSSRS